MLEFLRSKREAILAAAERHGGRNVRVFGSMVRGEGTTESDLDLLIELEEGRSLLDIVAIKQDLESLLDCRVDVVTEAALSTLIREHVLTEAQSL
jgi:predicted nucleotidyltransferase